MKCPRLGSVASAHVGLQFLSPLPQSPCHHQIHGQIGIQCVVLPQEAGNRTVVGYRDFHIIESDVAVGLDM